MATKEYLPSEGRKWRNDVEDTSQYLNYKGYGPGIVPDGADAGPLYDLIGDLIKRASRLTSAKWFGLLEAEEIESELWIAVLESPATEKKIKEAEPDLVVDLLVRMADRICIKERDDYEHFTGNYRYSVNEAKTLIEEFFLRDGENLIVDLIDVDIAFVRLMEENQAQADAVFRRYALGEIPEQGSSFKNYLARGLTHLTDLMNRNFKGRVRDHRDGPGTRPRIPNGYDPYEG